MSSNIELCRFCSKSHEKMHNLFSLAIINGNFIDIPEIIEYCLQTKIKEIEGISTKFCHDCKSLIFSFYSFRKQFEDNESLKISNQNPECTKLVELEIEILSPSYSTEHSAASLTEILPTSLDTDSKNETKVSCSNSNDDENSEEIVPKPIEYVCEICGKNLQTESLFYKHCKRHEALDKIIENYEYFPCHDCKKLFIDKEILIDHLSMIHDYSSYQPLEGSDFFEENYLCGMCDLEFMNIKCLKQHMTSHLRGVHCPFPNCGSNYKSPTNLTAHIVKIHLKQLNKCLLCLVEFNTRQTFLSHDCTAKKFQCSHCDKKFSCKRSLKNHLKLLNEKYKCNLCKKEFSKTGSLKLHQRTHTKEKPYECTICGNFFASSSIRGSHMETHNQNKIYECDICNVKLQSRMSHRNHVNRHFQSRDFECDTCSKKFYTKVHLKTHILNLHLHSHHERNKKR